VTDPEAVRPSRVGYFALGLVLAGMPFVFVGLGIVLIAGGMFIAFVMVLSDARDGRRVSKAAVWALILGPAWGLLLYGLARIVTG
jgi:hypothetical protein